MSSSQDTGSEAGSEATPIYVFAGPNGAGKSSVIGQVVDAMGLRYFNPDEEARLLRGQVDGLALDDANSIVWQEMVSMLRRAIEQGLSFAFETTLGGNTVFDILQQACAAGVSVRIWYVALDSADKHVERVEARVAAGGHSIPEDLIRRRYDSSRAHLAALIPLAQEVRVFDNSAPRAPEDAIPSPRLIVEATRGRLTYCCPLDEVPDWAKAIVAACFEPDA